MRIQCWLVFKPFSVGKISIFDGCTPCSSWDDFMICLLATLPSHHMFRGSIVYTFILSDCWSVLALCYHASLGSNPKTVEKSSNFINTHTIFILLLNFLLAKSSTTIFPPWMFPLTISIKNHYHYHKWSSKKTLMFQDIIVRCSNSSIWKWWFWWGISLSLKNHYEYEIIWISPSKIITLVAATAPATPGRARRAVRATRRSYEGAGSSLALPLRGGAVICVGN